MFEEEFFRDVDIKSQTSLECENFSEKALNALSGILRDENCKIERLYLCGVFDYTLVYSSDLYKSLTSASCTVRKLMIESSDNHGVVNALLMMVAASHNGFDSIFSTENDTLEITHDNVHLVHRAALKIRDLIIDVEEENVRELCSQLKNTGIQALSIKYPTPQVMSRNNLADITELIMIPNSITKLTIKDSIENSELLEAALLSPLCRVESLSIRGHEESEEGFIQMFKNVFLSPSNGIRQLTYRKHSNDWTAFIDTLTLPECKVQFLSIGAITISGLLFAFDDFSAEYLCEKIKSLEIKSVRRIIVPMRRNKEQINKALLEASRSRMMLTLLEGNLIQRTNTASLLRTLPTDVVRSMKKYF